MKNSHLEKSKRNQQIRKLLTGGRTQAEVAREFNITVQRLNQLVQKWEWQGLLERNEQGFALPAKGRTPAKVIHNQ
ncbi:MarR family transcriptional regulator [Candidatus Azambacteria bacterium]|nr:MarR family transcriptional regulator [Candidatus Azambacteria bacterium]